MPWNARNKKNGPAGALSAGTRISHYEIIRKIGATALGTVYLAEDTWNKQKVTLKLLFDDDRADKEIRDIMIKGAARAHEIKHPNLLEVYEVGRLEGRDYIVMEYAEGLTLRQMMQSGRLSIDGAVEISRQLCAGIKALHDNRMLAQLMIPEQVVVTREKQVKFINFSMIDTSITAAGDIDSLPFDIVSFMSPEQVSFRDIDERSNIFSLGILIYTMTARRQPFIGDSGKSVAEVIKSITPQTPLTFNPDIPERLNRIIMRMLDKNPVHRYQSVDEIINELSYFKVASDYDTYDRRKPKDSWNWVVLIAFIILLLISFWDYIMELIKGK